MYSYYYVLIFGSILAGFLGGVKCDCTAASTAFYVCTLSLPGFSSYSSVPSMPPIFLGDTTTVDQACTNYAAYHKCIIAMMAGCSTFRHSYDKLGMNIDEGLTVGYKGICTDGITAYKAGASCIANSPGKTKMAECYTDYVTNGTAMATELAQAGDIDDALKQLAAKICTMVDDYYNCNVAAMNSGSCSSAFITPMINFMWGTTPNNCKATASRTSEYDTKYGGSASVKFSGLLLLVALAGMKLFD